MAEDLIGKTIGHLTIVEKLPSDAYRQRRWLCRCDCSGQIILNSAQLRRGVAGHCGCRKPVMRSDLAGKRFGKLTVLGPSDQRGPRGKRTVPLWQCRCDCGEICYKATDTLTSQKETMCPKCANAIHAEKARSGAGYTEGTQLSKIRPCRLSKANTSGVTGVTFDKRSGKWRAQIGFKGQKLKLGYFASFEDAVKARHRAEEEYFDAFLELYEARSQTAPQAQAALAATASPEGEITPL